MLQRLFRHIGPYFKKVILSYGIVVGLPVLALCILVHQTGIRHVTQEICAGQKALCAQLSHYAAERLDDGKTLIDKLAADESIRAVATSPDDALRQLHDNWKCTRLFSDILLYNQRGVFYSAREQGAVALQERYAFGAREQAFFNSYTTDKKPRLAFFPQANAVMWIDPCPDAGLTLIGVISWDAIKAMCDVSSSEAMRYGAVVMTDAQQQRAFVQDWGSILSGEAGKTSAANVSFTEAIGSYGWQITLVIPGSYINARTQIANLALWMVLILIVSMLMVFAVSSYHYRPIRDLSVLAGTADNDDDFTSNELISIGTALRAGHQQTSEAIYQKNILRENLILRLINGVFVQEEELRTTLGSLEMLTGASEYMTIVMRHPHPEENISHEALMNYIDVRYSRKDWAYAVETAIDDVQLVVMLLKLPPATRDASPERMIADLQLFIRHRMNTRFCFGLSSPHRLERIPTSYMEALTAVFHCTGENPVLPYENLPSSHLLESQYNPEFQKKLHLLRHSLWAANETVVWQLLDELEHEYASSPTWRYTAFRLTEAVLQMVMDEENDRYRQADSFPELSRKLNQALSATALEEHRELMRAILQQMLDIGRRYNAGRESAMRERLTQWMQAHICDPDLSLTMLTEAFGFSVPYWSRLFTEQLGIGFNDWVWQSRLSLAKDKLLHTDLPIRQIVQEIGYTDVSSFSRRFKNEEGIPPGQYRTVARER